MPLCSTSGSPKKPRPVSQAMPGAPPARGSATRGTGGYGNPLRRDPEKVLDDVLDEKISLDTAEHAYGVVIDARTRHLDQAATQTLRASREGRANG